MRWRLHSGWSLGVLLIVIVAFIWNAASVLVQYIFADYTFFRPFFLTYLANSLFVVTLPLRSLSQLVRRRSSSPTEAHGSADSLRVTARAALVVCPLWFLANFRRAAPPLHRRCTRRCTAAAPATPTLPATTCSVAWQLQLEPGPDFGELLHRDLLLLCRLDAAAERRAAGRASHPEQAPRRAALLGR